ncbi:gas vesicle protein GvpJ [Streptomyces sp. wa22]|uniref:gas vesicle protein GvpJ n=1 Tax=Streptomyces sp. wa22 TaxID=1828244 RepID=UPI0021C8DB76|nr:gas vesicle protein GvpJ [Streptomyces sp. wa22]
MEPQPASRGGEALERGFHSLATGVVISGDLVIAIADVPLVRLSLHALLSSVNERVPAPWADGGPL